MQSAARERPSGRQAAAPEVSRDPTPGIGSRYPVAKVVGAEIGPLWSPCVRTSQENEMGMSKWLVAAAALSGAAGAQAQTQTPAPAPAAEKTMAYITPYVGYTHIR